MLVAMNKLPVMHQHLHLRVARDKDYWTITVLHDKDSGLQLPYVYKFKARFFSQPIENVFR